MTLDIAAPGQLVTSVAHLMLTLSGKRETLIPAYPQFASPENIAFEKIDDALSQLSLGPVALGHFHEALGVTALARGSAFLGRRPRIRARTARFILRGSAASADAPRRRSPRSAAVTRDRGR